MFIYTENSINFYCRQKRGGYEKGYTTLNEITQP